MAIRTYEQTVTILTLMKTNLPGVASDVGATSDDIDWVDETLANLTYLSNYCDLYNANKQAAFDTKASYFNGPEGGLVSDLVGMPTPAVPNLPLVGGVIFKLRDLAARFKLAPGYTSEIGELLGIQNPESAPINESTHKPTLDAFAAQTGYAVSLVVGNRANANSWFAEILRSGASSWENIGVNTGKSTDVTITPSEPGKPEKIQIQVRLRKNNVPFGLFSDAVTVTINP